ncbi:MAG: M13 family metallopeptidase, partial [Pseudomonadota bacterium]|nr:M13 family metallopeptidase [Pseudomonadota bacterium]
MTKHYLKPVALAISVALALTACGKQESASVPASIASASASSTAPATASTTAAVDSGNSIFDVSELDPSIAVCQDFNGFVNNKWVAANPIPNDRTRWGAFDKLADDSLNTQHTLVEHAARGADKSAAGSIEQKIGYLYASGMDEAAINKAGFEPIKPKLEQIDALKNSKDVAAYISHSFVEGDGQVFSFGSGADYQHADTQIGYANQSGLGLPTKDYYLDPKYKEIRDQYVDYITKTLTLVGISAADAKKQADAVLAFETQLAKASLAPVEQRNPANQYH